MRRFILLWVLATGSAFAQAPDFTAVARDAGASVVNVTGGFPPALPDLPLAEDEPEEAGIMRDFVRRYFAPSPDMRPAGSGFLIDAAGHIVTNAHLVADGQEITVRLADRRELEAKLVGFDPMSDIALLKIEAGGLRPVRLGDPARLRPGEWVAAIGSPFGLERSVTAGIVSALGRTLPEESWVPFIQTDVAVNPGNSGGPLFNLRGEVVGVTSGFYSDSGGYSGVSFAVPIDVAMEVVAQLRAHGKVTRGRIGVRLQSLSAELARAFQLPGASGALVVEVFRGGAAERAAIVPGDVITRFAGKPVENEADLVRLAAGARPGASVELEVVRFGAPLTARVRIDEARSPGLPAAARSPERRLGLELMPLSARTRERLRLESGVVVDRPGEAASRAGLARGDIILSLNGRNVSTPQEFHKLAAAAGNGATVALLVQREGVRQFLALRLPR
jgi:serine protease Do